MGERASTQRVPVRQAMDRVLAAERAAQGEIDACRLDADRILAEAREQARHILETAQGRIARIHAASSRDTADRIRQMRRESARDRAAIEDEPSHLAAVSRAAQELARRLTSRDHGDE